jgi:acyl-coenzyme A thioesterase PaaI-like protein
MEQDDFFKRDPFAQYIGAELLEVREGYAKARLLVDDRLCNRTSKSMLTVNSCRYRQEINTKSIKTT